MGSMNGANFNGQYGGERNGERNERGRNANNGNFAMINGSRAPPRPAPTEELKY